MKKPSNSIDELPDELLLKILSSLSTFKEAVATHVLSKRWVGLWKLVPDLKFDDGQSYNYFLTFVNFIYRSLLRNNAQILDSFHLNLRLAYRSTDMDFWVQTALDRSVRELRINLHSKPLRLPSCLSTSTTLKALVLSDLSIQVVPPWFRLPSLKTLHLFYVKFSGDQSIASLLTNCQVLEDLVVKRTRYDKVMIFNINVPSLRTLSIHHLRGKGVDYFNEIHGFVIEAPSLEVLNFKDTCSNFLMFEYMPKVIKANIEAICEQSEKFVGSFTSVQHLSYRSLISKTPYPSGTSFSCLKHLELSTCCAGWWDLLICMLDDAPKLQSLRLKSQYSAIYSDRMNPFDEPAAVLECLWKHLEILEWRDYEDTDEESDVAEYILANATCLKMAAFSFRCRRFREKHLCMLKKVKSMYRVSETCQLMV